jgi:hypothetical protein
MIFQFVLGIALMACSALLFYAARKFKKLKSSGADRR